MRLVGDLKSKWRIVSHCDIVNGKRMEMAVMEMAEKGGIARTYLDKTIEESGISG